MTFEGIRHFDAEDHIEDILDMVQFAPVQSARLLNIRFSCCAC